MAEVLEHEKRKKKRVEEADSATAKDTKADSSVINDDGTLLDKEGSDADGKRDGNGPDDRRLKRQKAEYDSEEVFTKKTVSVSKSNFETQIFNQLSMTGGKNECIVHLLINMYDVTSVVV